MAEPLLPQLPPRPVRRDREKENRGGYDCDLVEPPPEGIQTDCPVCLQILKEPCLISCCGHKFCRECIERVKKESDDKPCPLCGEQDFTFLRERGLERFLKGSEVWCAHKKEGCEWKGKLGKLQEHLNQDPCTSPGIQLNGCEFVAVECIYKCGEWFQRRHIATHQNEQCKKRPYSCDYCRNYASTFEDVTEIHYPQCDEYPVTCPNDCGTHKIERQDLQGHLRDKCPLTLVHCPFHDFDCKIQLPRKDMPEHAKETVTHLTLLATVTQRLSVENQKLTKENQQLKEREDESRKSTEAVQASLQKLMEENQELKERVLEREDESRKSMEAVQASLQKLMEENEELKQSTAASLTKLNMKCDSVVAQNESLSLKNQKLMTELQQSIQKLEKEKKQQYQELSHKQKIAEEKIQAHKEEEQQLRLDLQQLINTSEKLLEFRVKYTKEKVNSPAFYTHTHGYRMCVCVDPSGYGDGEGTHVSIFTYMMRGPFDKYLKWPFRGSVTIQIVNQVGGHDHVEDTIDYTDETPDGVAGRVIGRERASHARGIFKFIAYTDVGYNAARNTQYLKDNHLIVRVVKVVLK